MKYREGRNGYVHCDCNCECDACWQGCEARCDKDERPCDAKHCGDRDEGCRAL